jgi:4-hydroxy-tetrahydrodipicolinate reductase
MIRIAITGAGGRMGKALIEAILLTDGVELTAALERPASTLIGVDAGELAGVGSNGVIVAGSVDEIADQFDVLIDFTVPVATVANAEFCATNDKRMVIGTTGLDTQQHVKVLAAAESIAICMASNFSTGVNLC